MGPGSMRGSALAALLVLVACRAPGAAPVPAVVPVAPAPTMPRVAAPPEAKGEAVVTIVSRTGGYWPSIVAPYPPAELVRPCLEGPAAIGPAVTGWLVYALALPFEGPVTLSLLEKSESVSGAHVACITKALSELHRSEPGLELNAPLLVYVSLR